MARPEQVLVLEPQHELKFRASLATTFLKLKQEKLCSGLSVCHLALLIPFKWRVREASVCLSESLCDSLFTICVCFQWKEAKPEELMDSKLRCAFEMPLENDKTHEGESKKNETSSTSVKSEHQTKQGSVSMDDGEVKKIMEECKRLQMEVQRLREENKQIKEDDGLRKRRVTSAAAPHSSNMAMTAMKDEGLTTRVLAFCLLFFVIGAIIGKMVL
uniref:VAMP associated protein B and C n=1 Tax=Oryzias melastigma TaxID=30732 RepID=A0A3B3D658_ORYME